MVHSVLPNTFVCEVDFWGRNISGHIIKTKNAEVSYEGMAYFNKVRQNAWGMTQPGSSFLHVDTEFFKNSSKIYTLNLQHGGGWPPKTPKITIWVNGQLLEAGYSIINDDPKSAYFDEEFDITQYLNDGPNSIRIELDTDSSTYWIRSLAIQTKEIT